MTDPIDQLLALSKTRQIRYHARLWRKVDTSDPQGCWAITGYKDDSQYGAYNLFGHSCRAHRIAYALYHQTNPGEMYVLHRCDNRRCINPAHLFLGTQGDNIRDMVAKGRHWNNKRAA